MARSRSSLCQGLDRYRPKLTEYSCTVTPPCTYVNDLDFVAGAGGFIAEPGDGSARHTPARRPGERLCEIWAHVALVGWLEALGPRAWPRYLEFPLYSREFPRVRSLGLARLPAGPKGTSGSRSGDERNCIACSTWWNNLAAEDTAGGCRRSCAASSI